MQKIVLKFVQKIVHFLQIYLNINNYNKLYLMSENFDIIKLIEKNPITRLSADYQNKLLEKIKTVFTDSLPTIICW